MKVVLTKEESEYMFYSALCNAVGTGYMQGYGLAIKLEPGVYGKTKEVLKLEKPNEEICYEDVLMAVLRNGGILTLEDVEGEGEMTRSITLVDVHKRVQKTPIRHLSDMINKNDDAVTADVVLQTVFFKEVVFG